MLRYSGLPGASAREAPNDLAAGGAQAVSWLGTCCIPGSSLTVCGRLIRMLFVLLCWTEGHVWDQRWQGAFPREKRYRPYPPVWDHRGFNNYQRRLCTRCGKRADR